MKTSGGPASSELAAKLIPLGQRFDPTIEHEVETMPGNGGLTWRQFEVLRMIAELESPTLGTLADRLQVTPAVVTGLIDRLELQKFVQRRSDRTDARVTRVVVTELGAVALGDVDRRLREIIAVAVGSLSSTEQSALEQALWILTTIADDSCARCGAALLVSDRYCAVCGAHTPGSRSHR